MRARAIMVLGTSSHVGKSLLTAALCRIFAQQGYRVAPFKSQNMSLNSAATAEGLEIGRAQALQAEAAGIAPSVHMNPVLLKPAGEMSSQVVVRGKIWNRVSASNYHRRRVEELLPLVRESYEELAAQYEVIVLEGAGSPAEINLKQHDIVNMRMAEMADAACVLVGDIDRGGVFASLLGTIELLDEAERARIRGFVINKFRGDIQLLDPGIRMIEERLGKPCLGVVPYMDQLRLEEEDSLGLPETMPNGRGSWSLDGDRRRPLRVAVIAAPSFSNFTDFDALRAESSVELRFCRRAEDLHGADVIVLPGSKQTVDDLSWMRLGGLDAALLEHAKAGLVVGICGGMQMLGESITDPDGIEREGSVVGLGVLPIRTNMRDRKVTSLAHGQLTARTLFGQPFSAVRLSGYEIHVGETFYLENAEPFAELHRHSSSAAIAHRDGCVSQDGRVIGTYLHGIFDEDEFRHCFISAARSFYRLALAPALENWKAARESSFDRLAAMVAESLDMARMFEWVDAVYQTPSQALSGGVAH